MTRSYVCAYLETWRFFYAFAILYKVIAKTSYYSYKCLTTFTTLQLAPANCNIVCFAQIGQLRLNLSGSIRGIGIETILTYSQTLNM